MPSRECVLHTENRLKLYAIVVERKKGAQSLACAPNALALDSDRLWLYFVGIFLAATEPFATSKTASMRSIVVHRMNVIMEIYENEQQSNQKNRFSSVKYWFVSFSTSTYGWYDMVRVFSSGIRFARNVNTVCTIIM